ncbi:MAG: hypothetical protein EHM18_02825 [Acidobacteria bacterium]|nr:MAG: hypothetical protein EHM18_02825 [Acidobacteriota bacterium]
MKKLALFACAALATLGFAAPAAAADFGIVLGQGSTSSNSFAVAGSQGSSGSLIAGATTQTSQSLAASGGSGVSILSGNDGSSTTQHQSETLQTGSSASLGLAGSQNSNFGFAVGGSSAQNSLIGVWLFAQP